MPLDDIAEYLNLTALFRNQWGFRPEDGEDDKEFKTRVRATLREEMAKAKEGDLLIPQVAYGHFAANAEGNDLIIWKDESRSSEWMRFSFPRQRKEPWLCISDFFRSTDSGDEDFASFMLCTIGPRASEEAARLFAENQYQNYLFLHGLSVEMAEATAEYWHHRVREELGFANEDGPTLAGLFRQTYRGGRYSWGYPACPDLMDNAKVVELLGGDRVGVTVSEGFQLHPEQTTDAIICHHPEAKYFVA
jgi:5-methyltetrahydrofolate--homocysteine methyltransferase